MAEWIDMPSDSWSNPKVVRNESKAKRHLINYGVIMSRSFIVHAPASIDELQLTVLH
jgi:hypothetical protein